MSVNANIALKYDCALQVFFIEMVSYIQPKSSKNHLDGTEWKYAFQMNECDGASYNIYHNYHVLQNRLRRREKVLKSRTSGKVHFLFRIFSLKPPYVIWALSQSKIIVKSTSASAWRLKLV